MAVFCASRVGRMIANLQFGCSSASTDHSWRDVTKAPLPRREEAGLLND